MASFSLPPAADGVDVFVGGDGGAALPPSDGAPPLGDPEWPSVCVFLPQDQCGPDDWDVAPFPARGTSVLSSLRALAASACLNWDLGDHVPALSAEVVVGGRPHTLPLKDDDSLAKALWLWARSPGRPGGTIVLLFETGEVADAAAAAAAAVSAASPIPPPLPAELWDKIINAVENGRCVRRVARPRSLPHLFVRPTLVPLPNPDLPVFTRRGRPLCFLPGPRDAAMLACALPCAAWAHRASRWFRTVRTKRDGTVIEPAAFDVTVAPGENVQAAVDRCPPGGCVLMLPGTHEGPLVLTADKVVHVFGRRQATLRTTVGHVLVCDASTATVDGLLIRCESEDADFDPMADEEEDFEGDYGVWIRGGELRLQGCDLTSTWDACVRIEGGAATNPAVIGCR